MRIVCVVVSLCLWATVAAAQLPAPVPPECSKLPNGGKIKIETPGFEGPAGCQACAPGIVIPPNFVLGYSNGHHDTCELKKPTGENSGVCRADTQCPPLTTRTYKNNDVWVCKAQSTWAEFECPAPPRIPDPPQTVTTCIQRLKDAAGRVSTSAATFAAAKPGGGATPRSIGGAAVQASAMAGVMIVHLTGNLLPMTLKKKAMCDNVDTTNRTAVADCNAARADLSTSRDRYNGLKHKFNDARSITKREIGEAAAPVRDAGTTVTTELDNFERDAEVCTTEVLKITP